MDTIISKFRSAYEDRDVDALGRMYKPEAELSDPFGALLQMDSIGPIQGRKNIKEFFTKLFTTLPTNGGIKVIRRYEGDTYSVMEYEDGGMIFCVCFESEEGLVKKQRTYWGSLPPGEILTSLVEKSRLLTPPQPPASSSQPQPEVQEPISPPAEPEAPADVPPDPSGE